MQRVVNGYVRMIIVFGIAAAVWFLWLAFGRQLSHAVFRFPEFSMDDRAASIFTSTDFRYEDAFEGTLERYTRFSRLYNEEISTAVPGLEYTRIGDRTIGQMVPQGLCIAGDYMLVTAYDNGKKFAEENNYQGSYEVNRSVIYVLSNEEPAERRYLTTIVLPDINHVGGITFDGRYVWIAKSTTKKCSAIDYRVIQQAAAMGEESFELPEYTAEADCGVTASFVTYYDNRLWVGTYRSRLSGNGSLTSFSIKRRGGEVTLWQDEKITIPAYANGVVFAEVDGKTCMAVTSSWGRYLDSKVHLYEVAETKYGKSYVNRGVYSFPPMAEEMANDGEHTYFLFESAATCYSTAQYRKCSYPVDRVVGVSTEELFFWTAQARIDKASGMDRVKGRPLRSDWADFDLDRQTRLLKYRRGQGYGKNRVLV